MARGRRTKAELAASGPDWGMIEREYRAGQVSLRAISAAHGVTEGAIRKRAKECGWERDLTAKVRRKVREKLTRGATKKAGASDDEIVDAAAIRGVDVIMSHRRDIAALRAALGGMIAELADIRDHHSEIEQDVAAETQNDKTGQRRERMLRAVSLHGRSGIMNNLSSALGRLVTLERQAFNLDDDKGDGEAHEGWMSKIEAGCAPQN